MRARYSQHHWQQWVSVLNNERVELPKFIGQYKIGERVNGVFSNLLLNANGKSEIRRKCESTL